jgi:glutamine synthetase
MRADRPAVERVLAAVEQQQIELIRIDYVDWAGLLRGRVVGRERLSEAFATGIGSAQTNVTIGLDDHETDPALGPQSGEVWYVPDPTTFVALPWQPGYGHMFVDIVQRDGEPWFGDPRAALRRLAAEAAGELGVLRLGFEQEGHLLRREGDRLAPSFETRVFLADFPDLAPGFFLDMTRALAALGTPLEKFTIEGSQGMPELNVPFNDPLPAADEHARFKLAFRAIARQHELLGTFMPKPFADRPGAGCHVHISLAEGETGADRFAPSPADSAGLSETGRRFLAGLLAHADALCAIGSPTVNSYKRLQPGAWAPCVKAYGPSNRSAMIRIVEQRSPERPVRLELRSPDGTANSYLLAAAIVACGLDGVRQKLDPGPPTSLDVGQPDAIAEERAAFLPRSLDRALDALERDEVLAQALGPRLLQGWLRLKRQEWSTFSTAVTDWEQHTYADLF